MKNDDPCIAGIPTYGQCGSAANTLEVVTDTTGASVHVILGGAGDADYPVRASCHGLDTVFTLYSYPFGSCDENAPLSAAINLMYLFSRGCLRQQYRCRQNRIDHHCEGENLRDS